MPALATTHSLDDYLKLPISRCREQLRQGNAKNIEVNYSYKAKSYRYTIQLSKTQCNYGGHRYWWLCPKCYQRTSTLYCAGLYVCRHCIGANYGSQLQQPIDRVFSRIAAIRARLGWQQGVIHGIGAKPRYMHSKTFDKLVSEHDRLSAEVWQSTLDKLNCIG